MVCGTLAGEPKVALLYGYLLTILNADRRAVQKHAPPLVGEMGRAALGVRCHVHDREHRLVAGKNPGSHAGTKFSEQPVRRIIEIVEFLGLIHFCCLPPVIVGAWSLSP